MTKRYCSLTRPSLLPVFFCIAVATACACSQADVSDLQAQLVGKPLALRSYSAEPVQHYEWKDGAIRYKRPATRSLAVFTAESVKLIGGEIEIKGKRSTLLRDGGKPGYVLAGEAEMTLDTDLGGDNANVVSPQLEAALFYPNFASALSGVPAQYGASLPGDLNDDRSGSRIVLVDGTWTKVDRDDARFKMPKPLALPELNFSDQARRAKVNGKVSALVTVDGIGRVEDVWIKMPLGLGLDEQAAKAARQYRFQPALYDGKAVATAIGLEFMFTNR